MASLTTPAHVPSQELAELRLPESQYPRTLLTKDSTDADPGEVFVALLDILGFRKLCQTHHPRIIFQALQSLDQALSRSASAIRENAERAGRKDKVPLLGKLVFSDSILLYSTTTSPAALSHVVQTVGFAISLGLLKGLMLRGAITKGNLLVSHSEEGGVPFFLGNSVVKAHDLEKSQKWCGAVLDLESLINSPSDQFAVDVMLLAGFVRPYPVPVNTLPSPVVRMCVDWPRYMPLPEEKVREGLRKLLGTPTTEAEAMHQETLRFIADRPAPPRLATPLCSVQGLEWPSPTEETLLPRMTNGGRFTGAPSTDSRETSPLAFAKGRSPDRPL